jgi:hypothetical protein
VVEVQAQHLDVMGAGLAVEGPNEVVYPLAEPALGQIGQHLGVAFTGDQRVEHGPAQHAQCLGRHGFHLDAGVLEHLLDPLALAGAVLDEPRWQGSSGSCPSRHEVGA